MLSDLDVQILISRLRFVRQEGNYLVFFCPFHDDKNTPNFKVHRQRGIYRCFACGQYGSVKRLLHDLAPDLYPLSPDEAAIYERLHILEDYYQTKGYVDEEILNDIQSRRGLSREVLEKSEVRFFPEGDRASPPSDDLPHFYRRFVFPVRSFNGKVLNFIGWSPYLRPRYYLPPAIPAKPYGLSQVSRNETVYICEGVFDALSFWDIGMAAVGVLGNAVPATEIFALFPQNLVFVPDGDETGRQYAVKWSFLSLKERRLGDKTIFLPLSEDPNSLHKRGKLEEFVTSARPYSAPEVLLLYSLKHPEKLSPLFVLQFLAFVLPFPNYMTFLSEYRKFLPKNIPISLPPIALDGSVPTEVITEQILSDWSVIACAAATEDGRKILLRYFLPSEIKPLLETIPVGDGKCAVLRDELIGAIRRLLYIIRRPYYNEFVEFIKKVVLLEGGSIRT